MIANWQTAALHLRIPAAIGRSRNPPAPRRWLGSAPWPAHAGLGNCLSSCDQIMDRQFEEEIEVPGQGLAWHWHASNNSGMDNKCAYRATSAGIHGSGGLSEFFAGVVHA